MIGKTVIIKEGPFKDQLGTVVAKGSKGRYYVKLSRSTIQSFDDYEFENIEDEIGEPAPEFNKVILFFIVLWVFIIYLLLS